MHPLRVKKWTLAGRRIEGAAIGKTIKTCFSRPGRNCCLIQTRMSHSSSPRSELNDKLRLSNLQDDDAVEPSRAKHWKRRERAWVMEIIQLRLAVSGMGPEHTVGEQSAQHSIRTGTRGAAITTICPTLSAKGSRHITLLCGQKTHSVHITYQPHIHITLSCNKFCI